MKITPLLRSLLGLALVWMMIPALQAQNPWPDTDYLYRQFHGLNYRLYIPKSYNPNDAVTKHPMVIYLHGNGDLEAFNYVAGNPNAGNSYQMNENGQYRFVTPETQAYFPCFFILPQRGSQPAAGLPTEMKNLIDALAVEFHIDLDRVHITGLSGGGGDTLACASAFPDRYASVVPLSSVSAGTPANLVNVPTWFFHSVNDPMVGISSSDNYVKSLRAAGGRPIYTRYATGEHSVNMWTTSWRTPPLIPWMASQRRGVKSVSDPATVNITAPTAAGTYLPTTSGLTLSGTTTLAKPGTTADPLLTMVEWAKGDYNQSSNHTVANGSVGAWSTPSISLNAAGTATVIEAVAVGNSWSSELKGNTYYSATLKATQTPGGDAVAPTVNTTLPTSGTTFSTGSATIDVTGSAADAVGVTQVTWSNDRGGSGVASGTTGWTANAIPLLGGANVVTLRAFDAAGNMGTKTLTITCTLPPPAGPTDNWLDVDIGSPTKAGSSYEAPDGTITVRGSGAQILANNDQFHYTYKPITGDCIFTARVAFAQSCHTNGTYSLAVLMIRESISGVASRHAFVGIQGDFTLAYGLQLNPTDSWPSVATVSGGGNTYKTYWVKLQRTGNSFTFYWAPDQLGTPGTWTQMGSATTIGMASSGYIGFGVCSADNNQLNTASFDHITVTGPGGDNQLPTLGTVTPASGTTVTAPTIVFSGQASDNVMLQSVTCKNLSDNGGANPVTVAITGTTNVPWNVTVPLVSGSNTIEITCRDAAGNVSSPVVTRSVTYTPDTTAPSVTVTAPASGSTVATASVDFSGTASDNAALQKVTCKNVTAGNALTPVTVTGVSANWTVAVPLVNGSNTIEVTAQDLANNSSSIVTRVVTYTPVVTGGWTGAAIGSATGSFQQTGAAAFTVTGSGTTMSGNTVQHYYAYQAASGDCSITARVVSMQNTTGNSRVGVMIRESNNENAAYVFCGLSPGFGALASGHGDAATFNVGGTTFSAAAPYWVRVSRVGATITTSISSDGVTWSALGGTYAAPWVSMGTSVTVGLAVHSAGAQVATGTFDNVTTTGTVPPLWTGAAIGSATGSFQQTGAATLTVTGSGTTMSGNTVQHYYAYQTASDDCSITARVVSMQNTTGNSRVGVMIRESNNENAAYVFCGLSPGFGAFASGHGDAATFNVGGTTFSAAAPYWVRVSRVGATITTSISSDGVTWNALGGTYTAPWVSMGTSVTVGLAVHSAGAQVATGTFDNVTVVP